MLLILEAADLFGDAGCRTLISPEPVPVDGGTCHADLRLVAPAGDVVYVEAERCGTKKEQEPHDKWLRCYEATQGQIHVVTPS